MIKMSIKEESVLPVLLTNVKTEPDVGISCINDIIKIKDDPDDIEVEPNLTWIEGVDMEVATPFTYIKSDSAYQEPDNVWDDNPNIKIKIERNLEHIENANQDEERKDFKLNIEEIDIVDEILPNILQKDSYRDVDAIPFVCITADSASSTIDKKYVLCYVCNCKIYDVSKNYIKTICKIGEQYVCDDCENIVVKHELKEEISDVEKAKDTSNGEEYFPCDLCEFNTDRSFKLLQHMRIHTGEFACSECEYRAPLKSKLKVHMRIHTGEKPYACNLCEYKASHKTSLTSHNMKTHSRKEKPREKPFACNLCKYKSFQERHLKNHMRTHSTDKPFFCKLCGYKTAFKICLKIHMKTHTAKKPFACNLCKYKSFQERRLQNHMKTHAIDKPFSCKLCVYRTTFEICLKIHMNIHTEKKTFACNLCPYKTYQKINLILHKRTHSVEKLYTCHLCKYRTTQQDSLQSHIRIHMTEKLFACNEYEYSTNNKQSSVCHNTRTYTRTGEKQYGCNVCEFKTKLQTILKNHLKTHNTIFI